MIKNIKCLCKRFFVGLLTILIFISPINLKAQETVKIGTNFELSGEVASYGQAMFEGVQLAVEERNAEGGVLGGQTVEIISYDNTSNTTEASSIATRLISEGVVGIVGPATTGLAVAQTPIIQQAKVPAILPGATGDGITLDTNGDVYDYFFRVCFADSFQGRIGATYAAKHLNLKKAVIINDSASDYSQGLTDEFIKEFEMLGGEIVAQESFTAGDSDFSAILTSIAVQDFDVLYLPAYYTEAGLIIKLARELGIEQPIIGSDGFSSEVLIELAGDENVYDVYYTDHFSPLSDDKLVQNYLEAFETKFDKSSNTFSALAYDAAMLLMDAVDRAGTVDPEAVAVAMIETENFEGVTGTFSFDEFHNPIKSAVVISLKDGQISASESISLD